jgi:hypothetical protein
MWSDEWQRKNEESGTKPCTIATSFFSYLCGDNDMYDDLIINRIILLIINSVLSIILIIITLG